MWNLQDLYESDGIGVAMLLLIVARNRLLFLHRAMRFDNVKTWKDKRLLANLSAVRDLFEELIEIENKTML